MHDAGLDDARAADPVERLLEDSWESRTDRASRRELVGEFAAAVLFLAVAVPFAVPAIASHSFDAGLACLLVALYALVAGAVRFPIGAGYVVPSYVILVPMLLLLPPSAVPLFTAAGLVIASAARGGCAAGSGRARAVLDSERVARARSRPRAPRVRHAARHARA